jgi:hypothetical protein
MNLELIAGAISAERNLRIERTSLSGLYLETSNGQRLSATLARPATPAQPRGLVVSGS